MTTTATDAAARVMLAAETLVRITNELAAANEDVALLQRLSTANDRAERLAGQRDKALAEQKAALAAEAKAKENARFAGFSGIDVTDLKPDAGLLGSPFRITYTRLTHDMYAKDNVPTLHTVEGFGALNPDAYAYLIERHPEKIPAKIANLCPGNPRVAFERYFMGLRRGYIG